MTYIDKKNEEIDEMISRLERNDHKLTTLDLTPMEIRGQDTQERFIKSLKRNTHLTSVNISGTTWIKPGDFINTFAQNITITKFLCDPKKQRALPDKVMTRITHYLELNNNFKKVCTETNSFIDLYAGFGSFISS